MSSIPGDGGGEGEREAGSETSGRRKLGSPSWGRRKQEKGVDGEDMTRFLAESNHLVWLEDRLDIPDGVRVAQSEGF